MCTKYSFKSVLHFRFQNREIKITLPDNSTLKITSYRESPISPRGRLGYEKYLHGALIKGAFSRLGAYYVVEIHFTWGLYDEPHLK